MTVKDFDAGWAEQDGEPFRFRFLGREWSAPADAPAETILKLDRAMVALAAVPDLDSLPDDADLADVLPGVDLADIPTPESICRQLVGDQMVDEWLSIGCGYRRFLAMSRSLLDHYRGQDDDGEDEPDPNRQERRAQAAQARKSRSSSSTGGRSKRTGTASTAKTSTTGAGRTRSARSGSE